RPREAEDAAEVPLDVPLAVRRTVPRAEHPRRVSRPAALQDEPLSLRLDLVEDGAEGIGDVDQPPALARLGRRRRRGAEASLVLPELPLDAQLPRALPVDHVPLVVVELEPAEFAEAEARQEAGQVQRV